MFDLLIRGGHVVNGTGAPWFEADVGIDNDRVATVGHLGGARARRVIDAQGCVVAPGFIDMHSHSDFNLMVDPRAESKIRQGVTTEVVGQCGISGAPMYPGGMSELRNRYPGSFASSKWTTMEEFLAHLEGAGPAVNFVALVGHGNVRRAAMGEEDRPPTPGELSAMKELLREGLRAGAFGMSTGLIYPPGVYSETDELIALAEVLGEFGAIYFTHLRNERSEVVQSVREALEIGARGGCSVHISHLKAFEEENWGRILDALDVMEEARARGIEATGDQYPYTASSTALRSTLPPRVHDGGMAAMLKRLEDSREREAIKAGWADTIDWRNIIVSTVMSRANKAIEGLSIAQAAASAGADPGDFTMDLLLAESGEVSMVYFGMSEEDVREVMTHPLVMIGSDGAALAPHGDLGRGKPHPRSYGTFPRVLGKYVREDEIMPLELAVSKMTSWPASKLGLTDRGLIVSGNWADLTIFDPATVKDEATYPDPHAFPTGIEWVVVNGKVAVERGQQTDLLAGRVLRRNR